ncbi:hypothetical protein [Aulosira sp. FACHB-615]|uniref:hypothetical protein n=1 Tax=Aulosira sp. FACHB-615 TaxID=2692777 RepID=UPI0016823E24|nr:hypothetical protein [Aulosira sp. FACHB-615]MBD2492527.1 hypothetical protein [Aulosira sp. FACHB-615]
MAAISPLVLLFQAVDQASPVVKNLTGLVKKNFDVVTTLSFAYNQVQQSIQSLAAQGQKAYDLLIGQNVALQQQLLSTQATLAATNKVIANGVEVTDPTKAIQALEGPVNDAVARLRKGSLELVGVTSSQLIPLFQITAQSSASIGANLEQSADLTLSFAAALGTLSIPLDQARQELNSIYTAQITSDSQLAKSLGLNNEMVNQWRSQGILVAKLTERLGAFRAGNALAAQTIEGVSSNIQEIFEEITRVAGAPLLKPLVQQLNVLYNFLNQNKDTIQAIAASSVQFFLDIATKLGDAIKTLEPVLTQLFSAAFSQFTAEGQAAAGVITILVDGLAALIKASAPLLQVLANVVSLLAAFSNSPIGSIVLQATLLVGILTTLAPVVASVTTAFAAASATIGTVSTLFAALATGGIPAFTSALLAAATAAIAPLLPLIALGGAISVALIIKQTGDLKQVNEELETFREQNDLLSEESLRLATRLKSLNELERANGKLTAEQAKQRQGLQRISASQVQSLQAQIEAIKQLRPANEEQKRTQEIQIAQLERMVSLLNKQSGSVKLVAQDIPQLGNSYQQLQKKVGDALAQFDKPASADQFKAASKSLVDFTNQQVQAGDISTQEAVARLQRVVNDSRVELETQKAAQEAITKIRQSSTDERVKAAQDEQQKIQSLIASESISQAEGQRRITQSKLKELQIQLEATKQAIAQENALRQKQVAEDITRIDGQIAEAQKRLASAGNDKGAARIANEDIARLQSQRTAAQQSLQIDSDRQQQLKSQQQKFSTEIAQLQQQERARVRQEQLKDYDERQQILEASLATGLVTEQQYNQQSLSLTQAKINAELKQLEEQRAKLSANDKEGQEAITVRQAQLRKQSADANAKFQEQQLALVERNQKRATDAIAQSEADRQIEIAKFTRDNLDKKAEAEQQQLDLTRDRINSELALEQQKLSELQSLPPFTDPQKEENRQGQIRASRIKTAQLTKSLIDNEVQQRDAAFRVIETQLNREIQAIQNTANTQNQALEKEQQLRDFASKSITNQITLLEARKNLISSVAGFYEGELNVLKETTKNQKDQDRLAETAAQIRLNSARSAFEIEKEITQQKIEQKETELSIKELQLQGEQAAARAATLKAQAEQKKVLARPGATQEEKDAAALDLQAAQARENQLQLQRSLLGQERAIASAQGQQELKDLTRTQQLQDDQNRLALANARTNKSQGKNELQSLQRDILRREGATSLRDFGRNRNFAGVGSDLQQLLSPLRLPNTGTTSTERSRSVVPQSQFTGTIVPQPVPSVVNRGAEVQGGRGDININITNEFSTADATTQKAASTLSGQVRKELYDLGVLVNRS